MLKGGNRKFEVRERERAPMEAQEAESRSNVIGEQDKGMEEATHYHDQEVDRMDM